MSISLFMYLVLLLKIMENLSFLLEPNVLEMLGIMLNTNQILVFHPKPILSPSVQTVQTKIRQGRQIVKIFAFFDISKEFCNS
jgi:hypothetical protein